MRERTSQLVLLDGEPLVLVGILELSALEFVDLEPEQVDLARS